MTSLVAVYFRLALVSTLFLLYRFFFFFFSFFFFSFFFFSGSVVVGLGLFFAAKFFAFETRPFTTLRRVAKCR